MYACYSKYFKILNLIATVIEIMKRVSSRLIKLKYFDKVYKYLV